MRFDNLLDLCVTAREHIEEMSGNRLGFRS